MSGTKPGNQNPTGRDEENLGKTRYLHPVPDGLTVTALKKYLMTVRSETKLQILEHKVFKAIA